MAGKAAQVLISELMVPGSYRVIWDGKDPSGRSVASGVYFYVLEIGEFTAVKKMLMLK